MNLEEAKNAFKRFATTVSYVEDKHARIWAFHGFLNGMMVAGSLGTELTHDEFKELLYFKDSLI